MADVPLLFSRALNATHPTNLVFNEGDTGAGASNSVVLSAFVPAPVFSSKLLHARTLGFSASVSAPTITAQLYYDNAVSRGVASSTKNDWQEADTCESLTVSTYKQSDGLSLLSHSAFQEACRLDVKSTILSISSLSLCNESANDWQDGKHLSSKTLDTFNQLHRIALSDSSAWQEGVGIFNVTPSYYEQMSIAARPHLVSSWGDGVRVSTITVSYAGVGKSCPAQCVSYWQITRRPPPGKSVHVVIDPIHDPCYTPPLGSQMDLMFKVAFKLSTDLIFTCLKNVVPTTKIIPIQRTYIVINEVELRRVDGNHLLPDVTLSMNIDMDSWTWAFNASMPASALPLVEPSVLGEPVLLEANINGAHYLLLAEAIQRDRQFAKATITVSGRGQSAMLAEPYSPMLNFNNTIERTAQQLMNDALMMNGVSIGWSVDWRIEDWLVPVNTWNHQGSYMSAVTAIANAAGAFIQPDPVAKILRVRPRVPVKPWEMIGAVPDIILPSAAVTKEAIEWSDKPSYNVVYVSGTNSSGVLGCVKRSGSSGDAAAPMVTHALITNAIAARQRGIVSLANTGRMAKYSLSLPVFDNVGIVEVGSIIDYEDGITIKGVVQSASVVGSLGKVRQAIEVLVNG